MTEKLAAAERKKPMGASLYLLMTLLAALFTLGCVVIVGTPSDTTAELSALGNSAVDRLVADLTATLATKLRKRHTSITLDAPAPPAPHVVKHNTTCTWQEAPARTAAAVTATAEDAAAPTAAPQCLIPSFWMQQCGTERTCDACACSSGDSSPPGLLVHRVALKLAPVETAVRHHVGSMATQWTHRLQVSRTGARAGCMLHMCCN
jgi:hypothetical protein